MEMCLLLLPSSSGVLLCEADHALSIMCDVNMLTSMLRKVSHIITTMPTLPKLDSHGTLLAGPIR